MKLNSSAVKKAMLERGLNVKELAEKSNLAKATISKIINNTSERQYKTIGSIAMALNVDVDSLIIKQ